MRRFENYIFLFAILLFTGCQVTEVKRGGKAKPITKKVSSEVLCGDSIDCLFILKHQLLAKENTPVFKGNIKTINQKNFWFKKGSNYKNPDLKRLSHVRYDFNVNKDLNKKEIFQIDGDRASQFIYHVDSLGSMMQAHETNVVGFMNVFVPSYSKDGIIQKKRINNGDGIKIGDSKMTYDFENKKSYEIQSWDIPESKDKIECFYDEEGRVVKKITYKTGMNLNFDRPHYAIENEYENGKLKIRREYNPWEMEMDYKKSLYVTFFYSYNEFGDVSKIIELRKDSKNLFEISYKYDEQQNWISKHQTKNGVNYSLLERDLVYYDKML